MQEQHCSVAGCGKKNNIIPVAVRFLITSLSVQLAKQVKVKARYHINLIDLYSVDSFLLFSFGPAYLTSHKQRRYTGDFYCFISHGKSPTMTK